MNKLNWATISYFIVLHAGALCAPFCFSWSSLALFVCLSIVAGMGVTLGYHRLLTHGSFQTYDWVKRLLAFVGGLAGEGSAITWVADHRKHHKFTDKPGDPHSPRDGFGWSHILWTFPLMDRSLLNRHIKQYAPDLDRDPVLRFLDRTFILWHVLTGIFLFILGGWSWLVWGLFLRLVFVMHSTWLVNSACHKWGYRNYQTDDDSTNIWWLTPLVFGENFHNNHHAHQRMARHGHRWWEIDPTFWVIRLMEFVGLAWRVVR